jgi:hypothetical protein
LGEYTRFERPSPHARLEAEEIAMAGRPKKKLAVTRSRKSVDATEQDFIDRIYECAFLPELWPGVLNLQESRMHEAAFCSWPTRRS